MNGYQIAEYMSEKLKPCPFCGSKAEIKNDPNGYVGTVFQINCSKCKIPELRYGTPSYDRKYGERASFDIENKKGNEVMDKLLACEAVKVWNTRN